jgi:uncharacterized protein YggE
VTVTKEGQMPRTISVAGDAMIRVAPDEVRIVLDVTGRDRDLVKAQQGVDETVTSMVEAAQQVFAIKHDYIHTDHMALSPTYVDCDYRRFPDCDNTRVDFVTATRGLVIRLQNLEIFEKLMTELVSRGNREGVTVEIVDVTFLTNDLRRHRDQARELAAKAAREKADAVAAAMGTKVLRPMTINVEQANWYYYGSYGNGSYNRRRGGHAQMSQNVIQNFSSGGADPLQAAGFAPGQINVTANIRAVFEIE